MIQDIEAVIIGALEHADATGEGDHEVGDLQEALRLAWDIMTEQQRARFMADPTIKTIINGGMEPDADDDQPDPEQEDVTDE